MINLKYFKIFEKDIYLKESTEIKNNRFENININDTIDI